MPSFTCPHCGLVVTDIPASFSGKRMKCRQCSGVFELPMFEGFAEPLAAELAQPASPYDFNAGPAAPSYAYATTHGMAVEQPRSNTVAIVAFVMGIIGILICWVPLLGLLFCLLTLVLAIIGFVGSRRGRGGTAFSVIGGVLAALGMVVGIVIIPLMFSSMGAVLEVVRMSQSAQRIVEIEKALDGYYAQNGRYPERLKELPLARGADDDSPADPTVDSWNNPFEYQRLNDRQGGYRLWSRGPDGVSGNEDDLHPGEFEVQ
jgi:type II secretory pathway pseudopilin PulG